MNPGTVTVSVTGDSMRAYTDEGSLAPVMTLKARHPSTYVPILLA
ncbi:hypothetical protein [Herbidospora daliensis]|nr:hypothetical protein [Herbidospora daliensis]